MPVKKNPIDAFRGDGAGGAVSGQETVSSTLYNVIPLDDILRC